MRLVINAVKKNSPITRWYVFSRRTPLRTAAQDPVFDPSKMQHTPYTFPLSLRSALLPALSASDEIDCYFPGQPRQEGPPLWLLLSDGLLCLQDRPGCHEPKYRIFRGHACNNSKGYQCWLIYSGSTAAPWLSLEEQAPICVAYMMW